jgi:hypothetical protein
MISRALEELVPIIFLYTRDRRLKKRETDPTILNNPSFVGYGGLTVEQADERLKEERTRAAALDEKTFKLTLSLAIGLTVVGTAITALIEKVPGWRTRPTATAPASPPRPGAPDPSSRRW